VLLMTDDGDLAYRLTHPSFGIEKIYRAMVKGRVTADDVRATAEGIMLEDGRAAADLRIVRSGKETSTVEMTLHEGRKRQARRMLDGIGHPVVSLERISFGGITTKGVSDGSYRFLTGDEVKRLKTAVSG
jgi:23S rRNA pseudouridine2605 synthase